MNDIPLTVSIVCITSLILCRMLNDAERRNGYLEERHTRLSNTLEKLGNENKLMRKELEEIENENKKLKEKISK